ncbi:hypothetical protein [Streptomyces sp. NPDC049881]|uniref:hypothetical protein n=1 Tax=Streptomyces sp. NPDC049881 TaxID=3155778 RepID=UPI00342F40B9
MARLTEVDRARNEAVMERILAGHLPPGGKADLKSPAAMAGVTRTGFYPKKNRDGTPRPGPYQHLADEFERRLRELRASGEIVDPRVAQIERLKREVAQLKERITDRDEQLAELAEFKALAISRLVAQHSAIERLRRQITTTGPVRRIPTSTSRQAPYGSCS